MDPIITKPPQIRSQKPLYHNVGTQGANMGEHADYIRHNRKVTQQGWSILVGSLLYHLYGTVI